jgi:hypothetical protein
VVARRGRKERLAPSHRLDSSDLSGVRATGLAGTLNGEGKSPLAASSSGPSDRFVPNAVDQGGRWFDDRRVSCTSWFVLACVIV